MKSIDGTGHIVEPPDWASVFSDELDIAAAVEHWRRLTTELRDRDLLAPANGHAIERLVNAYVIYDRAAKAVAEHGAVTKPRRGNAKAIPRVSPYFKVMREASAEAAALESELGLSPRRRSGATKVAHGKKAARAADAYLKPVRSA